MLRIFLSERSVRYASRRCQSNRSDRVVGPLVGLDVLPAGPAALQCGTAEVSEPASRGSTLSRETAEVLLAYVNITECHSITTQ